MVNSMFNLSRKTALVTGGTRGIGQAMTLALAEAGADIILVVREGSDAGATTAAVQAMGRHIQTVTADLEDAASVAGLVPGLVDAGSVTAIMSSLAGQELPNGGIHILLNCASITRRHAAAAFPDAAWDAVLQTNLGAVFALSRDVGRYWLENGIRGRIVTVASLLSFQGGAGVAAYAASKHAVVGLTRALANEWAGRGIGVNAIAPGYVATALNADLRADPERRRQIDERIPAGRWGTPDDFKGVVVFLASEKASGYVSGETIVVDGGWMAR